MSRINRFAGLADPPSPGHKHVFAMVYGTTPDMPKFGFVTIPLTSFSKSDLAKFKEPGIIGANITGRMCPRSIRCQITEVRKP